MRQDLTAIREQFRAQRDPNAVFAERTAMVDAIVNQAVAELLTPSIPGRFAAVAVGGYGRGELFPFSDVDLLLLFPAEENLEGIKEPLAPFLRSLWDAGLRLSHSVRTVGECVKVNDQNTELHVSLLDLRFLAGDRGVFDDLNAKLPAFYQKNSNTLTRRLAELTRQRHSKFNDTVYHLEPNIKEAPGGVRDIHLLRWLAKLLPGHETLRECVQELHGDERFLFAIRCLLHF
jgi:[protein-PII] uridylyltransferase